MSQKNQIDILNYEKTGLLICDNGKSEFRICTFPETAFAASELQKYFKLANGAYLPVINKTEGPVISLTVDASECDRDSFSIEVKEKNILITGSNSRSVLYGVYSFLEQFCDIRFFAPDFEIVRKLSRISIPANLKFMETASFKVRQIRTEADFDSNFVDWITKNRLNSITADCWYWEKEEAAEVLHAAQERGVMTDCSGHAMHYFLKASTYFKKHPDWFPEVGGKRLPTKSTGDNFCYSNHEAVKQCAENIIDFCKRFPQFKKIDIWPGDGGLICECEKCKVNSLSDNYNNAMSYIAKKVKRVLPDIEIGGMAYNFDLKDKNCDALKLEGRKIEIPTMFAFWGQNLSIPLAENPDYSHQLVYDYISDFCSCEPDKGAIFCYHTDTYMNSNICPLFESAMAKDFKTFQSMNIDCICLLWIPWNSPESPMDMKWLAYQNGVLWGRLAMDTCFDVNTYRKSYYKIAFGNKQAGKAEELWIKLNHSLGEFSALIFPFAPPRFSDAWGCGFNRQVFKWDLDIEYNQSYSDRFKIFSHVLGKLIQLKDDATNLLDEERRECKRFKKYIDHCVTRVAGLKLIFEAQDAMRAKLWLEACNLLQQSLDTGMPDERDLTLSWFEYCQKKVSSKNSKTT